MTTAIDSNAIREDLDRLLRGWGRWAASSGIKLDYPNLIPTRRLLGSAVSVAPLDDCDALQVDAAISEIGRHNPDAQRIAVLVYLYGCPLRKIKDIYPSIGFDRARNEKAYLDGYLTQRLYNLLT